MIRPTRGVHRFAGGHLCGALPDRLGVVPVASPSGPPTTMAATFGAARGSSRGRLAWPKGVAFTWKATPLFLCIPARSASGQALDTPAEPRRRHYAARAPSRSTNSGVTSAPSLPRAGSRQVPLPAPRRHHRPVAPAPTVQSPLPPPPAIDASTGSTGTAPVRASPATPA